MQHRITRRAIIACLLAIAGCSAGTDIDSAGGDALTNQLPASAQCLNRQGERAGVAGFAEAPNPDYVKALKNGGSAGGNGLVALTFVAENPAGLQRAAQVAQILASQGAVGNFFIGAGIAKEAGPEQIAGTYAAAAPLRDGRNLVAPNMHYGFRARRFGGQDEYSPYPYTEVSLEDETTQMTTNLAAMRADYQAVTDMLRDFDLLSYNGGAFGRIGYVEKTGAELEVGVTCEMFEEAHADLGINLVGWHVDDRAGDYSCSSATDTSCETAYVNHLLYGSDDGYDPGALDFHGIYGGTGATVLIDLDSSLFTYADRTKRILDTVLASLATEGMATVRLDQGFGFDEDGTERAYLVDGLTFPGYYQRAIDAVAEMVAGDKEGVAIPQIGCVGVSDVDRCRSYDAIDPMQPNGFEGTGVITEIPAQGFTVVRYLAPEGSRIIVELHRDPGTDDANYWQGDSAEPRGPGGQQEQVVSYTRPLGDGMEEIVFVAYIGTNYGAHEWQLGAFQAIEEGEAVAAPTFESWQMVMVAEPAKG